MHPVEHLDVGGHRSSLELAEPLQRLCYAARHGWLLDRGHHEIFEPDVVAGALLADEVGVDAVIAPGAAGLGAVTDGIAPGTAPDVLGAPAALALPGPAVPVLAGVDAFAGVADLRVRPALAAARGVAAFVAGAFFAGAFAGAVPLAAPLRAGVLFAGAFAGAVPLAALLRAGVLFAGAFFAGAFAAAVPLAALLRAGAFFAGAFAAAVPLAALLRAGVLFAGAFFAGAFFAGAFFAGAFFAAAVVADAFPVVALILAALAVEVRLVVAFGFFLPVGVTAVVVVPVDDRAGFADALPAACVAASSLRAFLLFLRPPDRTTAPTWRSCRSRSRIRSLSWATSSAGASPTRDRARSTSKVTSATTASRFWRVCARRSSARPPTCSAVASPWFTRAFAAARALLRVSSVTPPAMAR